MASVNTTINVQINAANAAAQLAALQGKVANMNKGMLAATAGGVMAQEKAIRRMSNVLSGSGMFTTGIRNVHTQLGRMHQEFDRGSTTMQKYRQNSKRWSSDHSNINRMAADRVRMLQSQYVALGKEMGGVQKAMQIKPDKMMREFGADTMYAHQKAVLFRRNLQMGSTALVNWGKNTQWAGRQMMVGMGIPIAIASAGAIKSFNDIEKASISFKRVYGDSATSVAEKSQMLSKVQSGVAQDMTKYGVSVADTLTVAARAAATGAQGADLIAATRETMRLATLGEMDYNKALESTIATQTAFGISADEMGRKTDFLNAVENQTILSMEDMASAVPRVAPVIKGLGGNVEELAIMMTALRQGGVTAEQGANALKSGLASMINPTDTASAKLGEMGINLDKITKRNRGDIIGTVQDLGKAFDGLTNYKRQQALEALFGKYQYARMGALFKNIDSKPVKEVMRLATATNEELAKMSSQELAQISDSPMIKLQASLERLKAAAAPLGALLSDIAAKLVGFATPVVNFFSNNDMAKWALVGGAGLAALAGVVTMVVGVFANFAGMMVKAGMAVRTFFRFITGQKSLAYLTTDELNASAAANSLAGASQKAAAGLMAEARAAQLLTQQLAALTGAQTGAAASAAGLATSTGRATTSASTAAQATPRVSQTFTQAQVAKMLAQEGQTVRSHVGQPFSLTKEQTAAAMQYHQGKTGASNVAFVKAAQEGRLQGYSSVALGWGSTTNLDLSDSAKSRGVEKSRLLSQLQMRPQEVIAPFLDDLARNAGIPVEQVMRDPRVQTWANATVRSLHEGIAQSTVQQFKDPDVAKVASPILGTIKDVAPEYARGYAKMLQPEQYGIKGQSRVSVQKGVIDAAPGSFAAYRGRGVRTQDAIAASANLNMSGLEQHPSGLLVPSGTNEKSKAVGKRLASSVSGMDQATRSKTYQFGKVPGAMKPPTPVMPKTPKPQSQMYGKMPGMGMMGAGMLASTAFMGLEMAGKQVPAAAQFAAQGLMGVGMAAQMMPNQFARLSGAIPAVVGALGPWGVAIGAAVAAIGASAMAWKVFNERSRKQGIELGTAINNTTDSIDEVGTAFGREGFVQKQIRQEQGVKKESLDAATQFMQSDVGKKLLSDYTSTAMKVNQSVAGTSLASKLASYVINGVMGTSDVKAYLAALKQESPAMGSQIERYTKGLMGAKLDKTPAQLANDVYAKQADNANTAISILRQSQEAQAQKNPMTDMPWYQRMALAGSTLGMGGPMATMGASQAMRGVEMRGVAQRIGGEVASVWNSQIQSGLQNRLALEAQLNGLIDERSALQEKKGDGVLSEDEQQRLQYLNKAIPETKNGISQLGTSLNSTAQSMQAMFDSASDAQKGSVLDSLTTMIKDAGDAQGMMVADMVRNSKLNAGSQFDIISKLQSGALNSFGAMNMMTNQNQRGPLAGIVETTRALPIDKLQSFSTAMGQLTGNQAQQALTNFGGKFRSVAKDAGLSNKETIAAAKALGASDKQVRKITVKTKVEKGEDPMKDVKDKKVTVSASTDAAKKRIKDLTRAAEQATGKKVKIDANDNAAKVIKNLKKLIATSQDADRDVNVNTSTNAGETESDVQGLADTIMTVANVGPVNLNANDNASPVADDAAGSVEDFAAQSPTVTLSGIDNSTPIVSSAIAYLNSVNGTTSHTYLINHERTVKESASGGLFAGFAAGGRVHKGAGKVTGPGGPTDDKINARLSNGEFVIKASSVKKYGTNFMGAVNSGILQKPPGYAAGTPIKKAPLPPKENDGKGRQVAFNNEWRNIMYEASNFIQEFNKMGKIISAGKAVLSKKFKNLNYEFGRWIMDNYSPRQIKKMFAGKKDVGAKQLAKQYRAEQLLAQRDEIQAQKQANKSSAMKATLLKQSGEYGKDSPAATAIEGMSEEQTQMYGRMGKKQRAAMLKRLTKSAKLEKDLADAKEAQAKFEEDKERKKELSQSYRYAAGGAMQDVSAASGVDYATLSKYADALGMSMEDLAQQIQDGDLPSNLSQLGEAAIKAKQAMEVLGMSAVDKTAQRISNNEQMMSNYQSQAESAARLRVSREVGGGRSQSEIEAQMALDEANNAIKQAQLDDINKQYEDQAEYISQIEQHQQAIANLERGRLSVATALSTGDIAAAAAAAQQQRTDMAAFARGQMQSQMENQQKARTKQLQDEINAAANANRDIQNQIALIVAQENLARAPIIGQIQTENDAIIATSTYIADANQVLVDQNVLLQASLATLQAMVVAAAAIPANIAPAVAPTVAVAPATGGGGGSNKSNKSNKPNKTPDTKPNKKKGRAYGGWIPGIGNSDSVPIMATPGEYVVRKAQAAKFGPMLSAINHGTFKSEKSRQGAEIGTVVFNINGSNLTAKEISDVAVRRLQRLDSATIRGGRF